MKKVLRAAGREREEEERTKEIDGVVEMDKDKQIKKMSQNVLVKRELFT